KPAFVTDPYGLKTDGLVFANGIITKFDSAIWTLEAQAGDIVYYPELKTFSSSSVSRISSASTASTILDIDYGTGTTEHPYLIRNTLDMTELSRMVNKGNVYTGYYFKVDDNISEITLSGFTPIGTSAHSFEGIFDGNGINFNITISNSTDNNGLFGYVSNVTSIIRNLSVSGSIHGRDHIGGVVGYLYNGTVTNVYNTAKISGRQMAGGIVGRMNTSATITNTYNRGEIIVTGVSGYARVGGIVGYIDTANTTVSYSYSSGQVSGVGSAIGGVIGYYIVSGHREHLYYDISVIVNYDKPASTKPSTQPVTADNIFGITTGQFIGDYLKTRLINGWVYTPKTDDYGYYPELDLFANNTIATINARSEASVKIVITGGLGTIDMPFLITNNEDLETLKTRINAGNTFEGFYFKVEDGVESFILGNFVAIGSPSYPFKGNFDGNNAVFDLTISRSTTDYQGLFGYVDGGTIKNLSVTGSIIGDNYTGIVAYLKSGTIENVYNLANMSGLNYIGGIVGWANAGTIRQVYNVGDITGRNSQAGGIVGRTQGATAAKVYISNTYNRGEVIALSYAGGIVGYLNGTGSYRYSEVSYSYSSGLVSANSSVGGVFGYYVVSANTLTHVYYDVSVLVPYVQPKTLKPATTVGGMGLLKTDMIDDQLSKYGFSSSFWEFRLIEGNYAYYPQLKVFSTSEVDRIKNQSLISVRTNPFLGDGTEASPFLIKTVQDMINLSKSINQDFDAEGVYYLVEESVYYFDLSESTYVPIGTETIPFKGYFDGNFATFKIGFTSGNYLGLFGNVGTVSTIKNLAVEGSIKGTDYVGSVAGFNRGTIDHVYSTVLINANNYVGGLTGYNTGSISFAYKTGDISGNSYVGGLVGLNQGSILEAYFSGRLTGKVSLGGLVGYEEGTTNKAYYESTIIEYHEHPENEKPSGAFGNIADLPQARGVDKVYLKGLDIIGIGENQLQLSNLEWKEQDTSGLYDYYPQLTGFKENIKVEVQDASAVSTRTIRFATGSGTRTNPYIITTVEDMLAISEISREEDLYNIFFKVEDGITIFDLTSTDLNFQPIGVSSTHPFRGGFDGNGARFILNLTSGSTSYQGLFGYVSEGAEIVNLTVDGFVSGYSYVGGVVGYGKGSIINNVRNYAEITGYNYLGGIAGRLENTTIFNAYNMNTVTATQHYVGGIVGYTNIVDLSSSFNYGVINGNGYIGGIVGSAQDATNLKYVYNRNNIYGTGNYVGGITGYLNNGILEQSYSAGIIRGNDETYLGGLVGRVNGVTFESDSYYDQSIIEADDKIGNSKPIRAIGNKLEQDTVRAAIKTDLTGLSSLSLDQTIWSFKGNDGIDAFYPQLKVFSDSLTEQTKSDSLLSVTSYIFAGNGEEDSPYIIVDEYDMLLLADLVNSGNSFENTYFRVRKNAHNFIMNLSGLNYVPIGTATNPFNGNFDGVGTNFSMDLTGVNNVGLFGNISVSGTVKNLSVSGRIEGSSYVGSVAGTSSGQIINVYSIAEVFGQNYVGGLVGKNDGSATLAYMLGTVQGENYVGGLIGYQTGTLENVYSVNKVFGLNNIGGLVGLQSETGFTNNAYYNSQVVEIFDKVGFLKPTQAISNKVDTVNVLGTDTDRMTSGTLGTDTNQMNLDINSFAPKAPFGFNLYYPELKYFKDSKEEVIRTKSLESITIDRFTEGDGSEENPYVIRTASDMKGISDLILAKNTLAGKYFIVADDVLEIDLTDPLLNYQPIGDGSYKFQGDFDGNGTMFIVNISKAAYYQGLFGYVGESGVINNVGVTGSVYGTRYVGGIAGRNEGIITNSYNLADITANDYYAGGITGYNYGDISYTYNSGHIKINNQSHAGGIAGRMARNATISYSYNTGFVEVKVYYAGGIVGYSDGSLSQVYNAGVVKGTRSGAISGWNTSYATTFSAFYDEAVLAFSDLTPIATRAIGNVEDSEFVYGVNTSQLTGDDLYDIELDSNAFILKENQGYQAYYPQLKVFAGSDLTHVKHDSLVSVSTMIFRGEGTELSPYYILNRFDMKALASLTNQGTTTSNIYFKVYDNNAILDLSDSNLYYNAIGTMDNPFAGIFLGNDATIILGISTTKDYQGIFGVTASEVILQDFSIEGSVIGNDFTGSAVGFNQGKIYNVFSYANVTGHSYVGGIVGENDGLIIDTAHKGDVSGFEFVGGFAGENSSHIEQSYHMGTVNGDDQMIGGFAGLQLTTGELLNVFSYGDIYSSGNYVGGLVGYNYGSIQLAYHQGNILSDGTYASGISSVNAGVVKDVFFSGTIYSRSTTSGVYIENKGISENAYYDKTIIEDSRVIVGYNKPASAIHAKVDDNLNKGLLHEDMTGYYSIGTYDFQLQFIYEEWIEREGYDFVTYYPELVVFSEHENLQYQEDSLLSITRRKIDGEGTINDPYLIYDVDDMVEFKTFVENEFSFVGKYFKVADGVDTIDLTTAMDTFTPIGTAQFQFGGTFDGQGVNFVINFDMPLDEYIGLFHTLSSTAVVKNIDISGSIKGKSYVGSIAGRNMGTISGINNYASIISLEGNDIGGITGVNEGTIDNAINRGSLVMNGTYAGGITGENIGTITNSYNKGNISGNTSIAGIAGKNLGTIHYTYNTANISGLSVVGGVVGDNTNILTHSFNSGDVYASESAVGGVIGAMSSGQAYVLYNTGNVKAEGNLAGGIVGHMNTGTLYDTYQGGTVDAIDDYGAIVGQNISGNVTRSYYDLTSLFVFNPEFEKPVKAIGNFEDTATVKGLFRSQMAGLDSIGTAITQLNYANASHFTKTPSVDEWSFYPQIKVFAENISDEIYTDSLESVRIKTFILGSGTETDPFIIQNESDMIALAETTNSGNDYQGYYFKVADELEVLDFEILGTIYKYVAIGKAEAAFNGYFDGNGVNIKVNISESKDYQGLFGYIGPFGTVKNVSVSGIIRGYNYVGGIAGYNEGVIEEVYNDASINGKEYTGGLVGYHDGVIQNAYNHGEVIGSISVGGIAGYSDNHIRYTYNTGVIYGTNTVGALVGFLNTDLIINSYYDTRVLNAYRSYGSLIKPTQAVGNSINSDTVKGLDKNLMIGSGAIGIGAFKMEFTSQGDIWTTTYNIDDQTFYPQLKVFSRSTSNIVKDLSKASVQTKFYTISYDYRGATENIETIVSYVMNGYHYNTPVGFKLGYELAGWYYLDDELNTIKYTNELGESLLPYQHEDNISLYSEWEIAKHTVKFIDGNGQTIDEVEVIHGDYIAPTGFVPEKSPSKTSVYFFDSWDFDFSQRIIGDTNIYANYIEKERYLKVTFLNGDNDFFSEIKVEYGSLATPVVDIPRKTYIDDIAYKFESWDFDFTTEITDHITIRPVFSEVERYYQVLFMDGDGNVFDQQVTEYLASAQIPVDRPVKLETASHTFVFDHWEDNYRIITENTVVLPVFNEIIRTFEVTFIDGNGAIFAKQEVEYGQSAFEPVGLPAKASHDFTAYKFIGWDLNYNIVEEDMIINATFEAIDRYYTVNFYDGDNNVIQTETIEYLFSATNPEIIPTKLMTEKFVYSFSEWDKSFDSVETNLDIYPIFAENLRPYQVTFIDGNGEVFETQTVLYGQSAIEPENLPTKTYHDDIAYRFDGWDVFANITSDTTINSSFTPVPRYYYVTFYSHDNFTVLKSERVEYGSFATAPDAPIKEHTNVNYEYVFTGWDKAFNFVDENISVYPVYESRLKTFEVTFINGDETIVQIVSYGYPAIAPTPYKTGTDQITYSFIQWDVPFSSITSDTTVTASFEAVYNYFIVEFYDGNNQLISLQHVTPGESAVEPLVLPTKTKTNSYVYIFNSWDKSFEDVDSDLEINSIFIEVDRYYTVNFYNAINAIISSQTVEYGYDALEPDIPSKDMTAQYEYSFDHWSESFVGVSRDLDIYPLFTESIRKFEVNFIDGDGLIIETQMIEYGRSALAPSFASKTHTDDIYYIFNGWNKTFSSVTTDLDVSAVFTEVDRYYTVDFLDMYGNIISSQIVEYLTDAVDPIQEVPFIIIDDFFVNAVTSWDKEFTSVTSNLEINAVYEVKDRYYTVRFFDDLGGLLSEQIVEYGQAAIEPLGLTKEHLVEGYEYVLNGWSKDFDFVTSNLNVYPLFDSRIKTFTVTFINGDTITKETVEYNQSATPPIAFKESNDQVTYTFVAWDNDFRNVTEDITVTAIFDANYSYYVVEFFNGNGTLISSQNVFPQESAVIPDVIPQKDSTDSKIYIFASWDQDSSNVVENMKIYGVYDEFDRYYTVNFFDALNQIISTQTIEYGMKAIEPDHPVKTMTEKYEYSFVAWTKMFNNVKENLNIYPTYKEEVRKFEVIFIDGDGLVLETQMVLYGENAILPSSASKTHTDTIYYIFDSWNNSGEYITENKIITALFNQVNRYYTVNFYGQNNILLDTQIVEYMSDAVDPVPSLPFEIVDEDNVYAITSWDKSFTNVTQNLDVNAIYSTTSRYLTVRFYDAFDALISENVVEFGYSATAPGEQTKDNDEFYRYNFVGWDKDYSFVRTNMDIYPVFEAEQIKFTVTFVNGDESIQQYVLLGESAIAPIPYKSPTEQSIFVFVEWDKDYMNVTEDLVITAVFEEVFNFYTVTFYNGDGSILDVQTVVPGQSATEPLETPFKANNETNSFVFSGWNQSLDNISGNLDIYSLFEMVNLNYTVNFYDAYGEVISSQNIEYGMGAIAPEPPLKAMDDQYTYTFIKWSESFSNVKNNLDIHPVFEGTTRPYEVIFYNGDGIIIDTQTVEYGDSAVRPVDATKTPNGNIYYVFDSWVQPFDFITGDLSVYPSFIETDRYYDVIFYDDLGDVLDTQVVEYGKDAVNPIPYLPFDIVDENNVYAIIGWDKSFTKVTTDLSINAIYGTVDRYYQVRFFDFNSLSYTEQTVEYGYSAIAPTDPIKPEDDAFVYSFVKWDKDYSFVRNNMDIYPIFEQTMSKFSVIFYDGDGNVYETQIVYQGQSAITPDGQPYKSPTASSMFVFRGWDKNFEFITEHTEVYPLYDELVRTFIVQFIDNNGLVLKEEFVQYGQSATAPTNFVTPLPTEEYLYVPYWDTDFSNVKEDLQVQLYFEQMIRNYTYSFYDYDGTIIKTVTAEYGSTISLP
ncbi:MAG: InlB B-repeat-containing protein, partial [Candidatus Izemoplasmatales bacterium]